MNRRDTDGVQAQDFSSIYNLSDFLNEYERVMAVLGVVSAISLIAQQTDYGFFSYTISGVFLFASGIVFAELRAQFPDPLKFPLSWDYTLDRAGFHFLHPSNRLGLFSILLDIGLLLFCAFALVSFSMVTVLVFWIFGHTFAYKTQVGGIFRDLQRYRDKVGIYKLGKISAVVLGSIVTVRILIVGVPTIVALIYFRPYITISVREFSQLSDFQKIVVGLFAVPLSSLAFTFGFLVDRRTAENQDSRNW